MLPRICRVLLVSFALAAQAPGAAEPKEEQIAVAERVREIFEAKCLDCHGPELPRPKGKFGYVLDLKRMAENPDYVVKGKPEASELYIMVRDDEMPGEDANVPPLTPEEKATVRRWIEIGAPAGPRLDREVIAMVIQEPTRPDMPLWKRALRWVGRFHPLSTHFPVALLLLAVFAESLAWWTQQESWMQTVRFLVIIGALGALAAAGLGWVNAWFTSYVGESASILWWHRWLGTGTAAWAAVCAALSVLSECKEGSRERQQFRGALLLGAALVGVSGFLGSALIYGLDHYAWD